MKKRKNPETGLTSQFVMLDSPDWVNIIPVTVENKIVMIEQYRHGTDSITLELPGGMVEQGEMFIDAARRECLEETGFEGNGIPEKIGEVFPNPAFMNNKCTTFLWRECVKVSEQNLDHDELIKIKEFSFKEVKSLIENGVIRHAIILNAFFFLFLKNEYKFD